MSSVAFRNCRYARNATEGVPYRAVNDKYGLIDPSRGHPPREQQEGNRKTWRLVVSRELARTGC